MTALDVPDESESSIQLVVEKKETPKPNKPDPPKIEPMSQALVPFEPPKLKPVDETQARYKAERYRREQKKQEDLYR